MRKTIEALDIEEKRRNELIKQTMDKMMESGIPRHLYTNSDRLRDENLELLMMEESKLNKLKREKDTSFGQKTITTGNEYGFRFTVPLEVYSNAEYREYLNYAKTAKSVRAIIDEYYRKYGKRSNLEKPLKRKHWWQ